jgi:hypothetical protein
MTEPTAQDYENAAVREAIAAKFEAEYRQVVAWADRIMGPGWEPVGRHYLVDKDEEQRARREGGPLKAAATVYTVSNGVRKRHFMIRDDKPVECAGYEEAFGPMLLEPHPTQRIEVRGEMVAPHRYSLCWAPIEMYRPRRAEELAAMRERRQEKVVEREAQENPLFSNAIRSGEWRPRMKRRER